MKTRQARWAVAVGMAALATVGCSESSRRGGDGGSIDGDGGTMGGDGGTIGGEPAWETYCETTGPEHATACGEVWDDEDTLECLSFAGCAEGFIRPDLFPLIPGCLVERDCGTGDDSCYAPEGLGSTSSDAADGYRDACLAKRSECSATDGSFSDDICFAGILTDDLIADLQACLDRPCVDVRTCFDSAVPDCT